MNRCLQSLKPEINQDLQGKEQKEEVQQPTLTQQIVKVRTFPKSILLTMSHPFFLLLHR